MKYPNVTLGRVEAVWNKLGGEESVERFLRGELMISESTRRWREQDGVIYFSVISDGATNFQWIERLEKKGYGISNYAESLLRSPDFKPTSGVTYEVAVLKGILFEDNDRVTKKIRAKADCRNLNKLNVEVACLIREKFTDKELEAMGLWWVVVMHKPIKNSDGCPSLLIVDRSGSGPWLGACCVEPDSKWGRDGGFAFVISQIGA